MRARARALPFRVSGVSSRYSITALVASCAVGPTMTRPGSAADCSRAATLTASPVSIRSRGPLARSTSTRTSPASTPIRIASWGLPSSANSRFSSERTACISIPAFTARSASSSCARGTPNTARIASPMNFSSRPSCRVTSSARRSNARPTTACTTSGSSCSASAVEPTRSANSAVANLRSWRLGSVASSGSPHRRQNRARSGFSSPHRGQGRMGGA